MDKFRLNGAALIDGEIKPVSFISYERSSETSSEVEYRLEFGLACISKGWEPLEFFEIEYI